MKKFTIQAILLLVVIGVGIIFYKQSIEIPELPFLPQPPIVKQLQINNAMLKVEIADTQSKRSKGLGGRESLASDEGMLFMFDKPDRYPFWMKGLTFPLDFVWIRGEKVVDITQSVQPPAQGQETSSLPIYQPKEEVNRVLEVNAGTAERLNIKVGDIIFLN